MSRSQSILFDRSFQIASLLGTLIMGVLAAYGTVSIQIALVGTLVSMLTGVSLTLMKEVERFSRETSDALHSLGLILPLTADAAVQDAFQKIIGAMQVVSDSSNIVFRTLAGERISSLTHDFRNLSQQRLVYVGTEAWRTAYAEVLQQSALKAYHSVAWVRSANYWQDQPGLQSLRINCELAARGVPVTRILILGTSDARCRTEQGASPESDRIHAWMKMQHKAGIRLLCVEEDALQQESDLLCDFGIYGDIAVGILDAEETSARTLQFRLTFDPMDLEIHREKWERLLLYATEWYPSGSDVLSNIAR